MVSFENDYNVGAHPKILEKLVETNLERLSGYTHDKYCQSAEKKIKKVCNSPKANVFFLIGGTRNKPNCYRLFN